MTFTSLTVSSLVGALRLEEPSMKVYSTISYGDRADTMQAIPATDVNTAYLADSSYSDTGHKVTEDHDVGEDVEDVVVLNFQELSGWRGEAITAEELIAELVHEDENSLVATVTSYGDRSNTMQAIPATEVNTAFLKRTEYSNTKLKLVEEGDEDDDSEKVIVLNYDFL